MIRRRAGVPIDSREHGSGWKAFIIGEVLAYINRRNTFDVRLHLRTWL